LIDMPSGAAPLDVSRALSLVYLFRDFDAGALARVSHAVDVERYQAGEAVAREGDEGDALFVVASGSVRVAKSDGVEGDEQVVLLAPGQHVGEISVLDGAPRSASVVAAEPSEIYRLRWDRLRSILDSEPRLGASFYLALARVLATRLRATTDDVAFLKHLARARS
jgi:CRP-like cAMP-binding protein